MSEDLEEGLEKEIKIIDLALSNMIEKVAQVLLGIAMLMVVCIGLKIIELVLMVTQ